MAFEFSWAESSPHILVLVISENWNDVQRRQATIQAWNMIEASAEPQVDLVIDFRENTSISADVILHMRSYTAGWHPKTRHAVMVTRNPYALQLFNVLQRIAGHMFIRPTLTLKGTLQAALESLVVRETVSAE